MKYLVSVSFLIISLGIFFLPEQVPVAEAAIVPCDGGPGNECGSCQFLQLGQRIINWLITTMTSVIVLVFAWGGFKMVTAGGDPGGVSEGKQMMTNAIIGFVIMLAGWLIVDTFIKTFTSEAKIGVWNRIECTTTLTYQDLQPGTNPGTDPRTTPSTPGERQQSITSATSRYRGTSTANGPGDGTLACVWAVNNVLRDAGVAPIDGNSVSSMESELRNGRGSLVSQSSAVAGDIVVVTDGARGHTGICLDNGCTRVLSNSSGNRSFSWVSNTSFSPSYNAGPGRIYRVNN